MELLNVETAARNPCGLSDGGASSFVHWLKQACRARFSMIGEFVGVGIGLTRLLGCAVAYLYDFAVGTVGKTRISAIYGCIWRANMLIEIGIGVCKQLGWIGRCRATAAVRAVADGGEFASNGIVGCGKVCISITESGWHI